MSLDKDFWGADGL